MPDVAETFDVGVVAPGAEELSAAAYIELGRLVEHEGFHTFTIGEIAGYDAFAVLSAVAASTSRVRLGTGVIPIYTRAPVLAAMGFASLAASAPGRVVAGLGTGSHRIVEDWQGRTLDRPIETMRAYVAILRAALAGERVDLADGPLPVDGFRLQHPPVPHIPVFIGAFKPRMLRLAGAIADGVILSLFPPDQLAPLIAEVRAGAEEAGRDPGSIEVLATVHAYAGPHVEEAVERLRRVVLQYSVRPTHRPAFEATFPRSTAPPRCGTRATERRRSLSCPTRPCITRSRSAMRVGRSSASSWHARPGRRCRSSSRWRSGGARPTARWRPSGRLQPRSGQSTRDDRARGR